MRTIAIAIFLASFFLVDTGTTGQTELTQTESPSELRLRMKEEPTSLNPVDGANWSAGDIHAHVLESLLMLDLDTNEWRARLAEKWERSADDREFTFHLRRDAQWSDGVPLTAHDVKFSFDAIFDDRFASAQMRPYYQGIESVEVVNDFTVLFRTKTSYFGNFISCAQMSIVPRHIYGRPEDSEKLQTTIVGSGPYTLDDWQFGRRIRLKRNPKWWGWASGAPESLGRPEALSFFFITDNNVTIEMLRKGEIDFSPLTSDEYKRLSSEGAQNHFEVSRVQNEMPKTVRSLAFNLDRPMFQDIELRRAMGELVDRDMITKRFFHGFMIPAAGPWYVQSEYADASLPPQEFNPRQALERLRARGWRDTNSNLVLDLAGRELKFTVLTFNADDLRYLTVIREDARQIGVNIQLKLVSETVFNEAMRTGEFDAAIVSRGAAWVEFDPKVSWHSTSLPLFGYNFGRYRNPHVDTLVEQAVVEPNFEKRVPLMRELYRTLVNDAPEIFLFAERDSFYAVNKRVMRPKPTLRFDIGSAYWSVGSPR